MTFEELLRFIRKNSRFYGELYKTLPEKITSVENLPVLTQDDFWAANSLQDNRLLTGPMRDGIVLKSGGTTGNPKFSVFSRDEWNIFTQAFAKTLAINGLKDGDRVANLFYVGELYGSFIFTHKVFEECPKRVLQLPIAGSTATPDVVKILQQFEATVIAGIPTTLLGLIEYLEKSPALAHQLKVRLILFAGEAMYADQRERVAKVLPGVEIRSIGYASTDAGFLGYADLSCGENEFRCHEESTLFEILDEESNEVIGETGRPGRAIITDLKRVLMPLLRYPVGDRAQWLEPKGTSNRKFQLLGRSEESARIGPVSLYFEDVRSVLEKFKSTLGAFQFQLVLFRSQTKDGLLIRIAANSREKEKEITQTIYRERPMYREAMEQGKIQPISIEWVDHKDLETNPRSGKMKRIIDKRS